MLVPMTFHRRRAQLDAVGILVDLFEGLELARYPGLGV